MKKIIIAALIAFMLYQISLANKSSPSSSYDGGGEQNGVESFITGVMGIAGEKLSSVLTEN